MADTQTEARIVGLMLVDPANISRVIRAGITSSDYQNPSHGIIHNAIVDAAIDTDGQVDGVTVASRLAYEDRLDSIGGVEYIGALVASVRSWDCVPTLARQLHS